jgi:PhnB protein
MPADPEKANAEAGVRAVMNDRAKAVRDKDVEGVLAHCAADIVTFDLAPPLISTRADARGLEAWFATWRGPIGYEIHDLKITVGGDAAFCHSLDRLSGMTIDGETNDIWFRRTVGLRRIGGEWKIVHEHESVPFYMDGSYRAAVDLEP